MEERRGVGDGGTPVMTDHDRLAGAQCVYQDVDVGGQLLDRVRLDRGRLVAVAVAAYVGRRYAVAGIDEGADLVAPGIPAFREAMDEHDQRPRTCDRHAQ